MNVVYSGMCSDNHHNQLARKSYEDSEFILKRFMKHRRDKTLIVENTEAPVNAFRIPDSISSVLTIPSNAIVEHIEVVLPSICNPRIVTTLEKALSKKGTKERFLFLTSKDPHEVECARLRKIAREKMIRENENFLKYEKYLDEINAEYVTKIENSKEGYGYYIHNMDRGDNLNRGNGVDKGNNIDRDNNVDKRTNVKVGSNLKAKFESEECEYMKEIDRKEIYKKEIGKKEVYMKEMDYKIANCKTANEDGVNKKEINEKAVILKNDYKSKGNDNISKSTDLITEDMDEMVVNNGGNDNENSKGTMINKGSEDSGCVTHADEIDGIHKIENPKNIENAKNNTQSYFSIRINTQSYFDIQERYLNSKEGYFGAEGSHNGKESYIKESCFTKSSDFDKRESYTKRSHFNIENYSNTEEYSDNRGTQSSQDVKWSEISIRHSRSSALDEKLMVQLTYYGNTGTLFSTAADAIVRGDVEVEYNGLYREFNPDITDHMDLSYV